MKQLLPALAVVGGACGLVATPTAAVELGTLEVQSSIGQPLRGGKMPERRPFLAVDAAEGD